MIGKPSAKYKYLGGEPTYVKQSYQDLNCPLQGVEGNQVCANSRYVAIPWKGGGGVFTVKGHDEQGRVSMNTPVFKGHTGPIQDMEFSPFHENMLATASGDATVRLWAMPQGQLTETTDKAEAILKGHSKKVMLMQWHPSAEMTIASAGQNGGVRIWDVQMEKTMFNYTNNTAVPWSMAWNHNGSLVSLFTKEKKNHIIDPRSQASVAVVDAHQGSKAQRVQWKGAHNLLISVGTNDFNDREYQVWDPRDWSKPLVQTQLDTNTQVCWTYYDDVTNLFFVTNKGSTFTQMLYFSETGERTKNPELIPLSTYNGKQGTHYFYFLPKQAVDPFRKEILRALRFTGKDLEFITFKVPRKEEQFSTDLYPPHRAMKAAQSFDEWSKGTDKAPVLEEFNPDELQEKLQGNIASGVAQSFAFQKKPGAGADEPIKAKPAAAGSVSAASAAEISKLQQQVNEQKSIIAGNEQTIKDLSEKLKAASGVQDGPAQLDKPLFGYFDIRGQAQPIRYMLAYAGVDFDEITYTQEDLGGNLPQMPFFKDKMGTMHEDSLKILKFIANTYKKELMPQNEDQNIQLEMLVNYLQTLNSHLTEYCYGKHQDVSLQDGIYEKLTPITSLMKQQDTMYLLSNTVSYVDFYLYECTDLLDFLTEGQVYTNYPELYNFSSNMATLLQPFWDKNDASLGYPFFHRFTQTNNWPEVNFKNRYQ